MIAANGVSVPNGRLNAAVAVVVRWMMAVVMMTAAVVVVVIIVMVVSAGAANRSVPNVQYMRLSLQIVCYRVLLKCRANCCRQSRF